MGKFVSKLRIFGSLVKESAMFSISQLKADKFRTFLSLLGIVIGIFSIVAVFSVVSAMRQSIASGFSSFGSDVMYVMQYPILPEDGGEYKWWEYRTRPQVTEEEYKFLKENVSEQSIITAFLDYSKTVKYMRNSFSSTVCAVDKDWEKVSSVNLAKGRYFTEIELENGSAVTILGSAVADALFPNGQNPEGKTIKVAGRDVVVIGTLAPSGSSMANYAAVTEAGYEAVKSVFPNAKVIVHIDNGWDKVTHFTWILDGLKANGCKWDVIGMSLYPTAANYGTYVASCIKNIQTLYATYKTPVMIAEVGFAVGDPTNAKTFLTDLMTKAKALGIGQCLGVFYWEPECDSNWKAYKLGAFDDSGKPTAALEAFAN